MSWPYLVVHKRYTPIYIIRKFVHYYNSKILFIQHNNRPMAPCFTNYNAC